MASSADDTHMDDDGNERTLAAWMEEVNEQMFTVGTQDRVQITGTLKTWWEEGYSPKDVARALKGTQHGEQHSEG